MCESAVFILLEFHCISDRTVGDTQYFQDYPADKHETVLNQVLLQAMKAYPSRVGSSPGENIFSGPPVRADRLKSLHLIDRLSFAK
jgi:hypothetical protein